MKDKKKSNCDVVNINGVNYIKKASDVSKVNIDWSNHPSGVPFSVGCKYFFRTVTYHMVGRVDAVVGNFLVLSDASWIADSGRFMQAIKKGVLDEVEPVGDAYINLDAVVDAFPWCHSLPDIQK